MPTINEDEPFNLSGSDLDHLRRRLGKLLQPRTGGWAITKRVGHLALPSGQILHITSRKASTRSLLTWIAFADPSLAALNTFDAAHVAEEGGDLGTLVAKLFVDETLQVIRRVGLVRDYIRQKTPSPMLRGRIDFASLVRRTGLFPPPCIVWERSADCFPNLLLNAAHAAIGRSEAMRGVCGVNYRRLAYFLASIRPSVPSRPAVTFSPLNRLAYPYARSVALARLVLQGRGMRDGQNEGSEYLINLERLFEAAVWRAFRDRIPGCRNQHTVPFDQHPPRADCMYIDLFIPHHCAGPLVVDAKYKSSISSQNLHQMISYCFMTGARHAVLVLPASGAPLPQTYRFLNAKGGHGVTVHVCTLEVSADNLEQWQCAASHLVDEVCQRVSTSI